MNITIFRLLEFYGVHCHHPGQWKIHEYLRRLLNADLDQSFEVERDGFKWSLNPADFVENDLFWLGRKDHWDCYHIRRLMKSGVVFDIGANFGYYTISVFNQRRVYSFEPFPPTLARLQHNLQLNSVNGSVTVVPVALSDFNGVATMGAPNNNSGAARVGAAGDSIPTQTLDDFCTEHSIAEIGFIKIDVEGHEERVLRGAEKTLRTLHPPMMVEFDAKQLNRSGSSVGIIATTLERFGYSLFVSQRKKLVSLTGLPAMEDVVNVFCV